MITCKKKNNTIKTFMFTLENIPFCVLNNNRRDMNDVPRHTVIEIEDFFESYKKKIGVEVVLEEFQGKEPAFETIKQAFAYYQHLKTTREALIAAENKAKGKK